MTPLYSYSLLIRYEVVMIINNEVKLKYLNARIHMNFSVSTRSTKVEQGSCEYTEI